MAADTDTLTPTFNRLRPRLQGIAYRMLGTLAEAEEVVQDAWLRWHEADADRLDSPEAWLVTITTRLAIDRLRAAKVQRAHYSGIWLPEPLLTDGPASPETLLAQADAVSTAFLLLLERLAPEARAAFLLREVFDTDYADVARMIGKTEAACRQIVHRAKQQVGEARPRYHVPPDTHRRLLAGFAQAMRSGDMPALRAMLAEDAELVGDGGGKVNSFAKPMAGGQRIAQLFYATHRRVGAGQRIVLALLNGQWGVLRFMHGVLESAQSFQIDDRIDNQRDGQPEKQPENQRIRRIQVQRNPDKLARIAATLAG